MSARDKTKHILMELKGHSPFTAFGAVMGIAFMLIFRNLGGVSGHLLFSIFHPAHVVLSAMVTASMFKIHSLKNHFLIVLLVGYFGSIGVATLSDIIIPYFGSEILGLDIPTHADVESHTTKSLQTQDSHQSDNTHKHKIHFGFIEEWYIVNPAAFLGIFIAFLLPRTKFPHAAHILVSTWASASYLLMDIQSAITIGAVIGMFVTLFIAVWLPCCFSDIIFPLLFVKPDVTLANPCPDHSRHSHPHLDEHCGACK